MTKPTRLALVQADAIVVSMNRARRARRGDDDRSVGRSVGRIKELIDMAHAAAVFAERQHRGRETELLAIAVKAEALRHLGAVLKVQPKAQGVRMKGGGKGAGGSFAEPPASIGAPTLADLGLSKKEAMLAQRLDGMPEADFEQVRDGTVSAAKAVAAVAAQKKAEAKQEKANPAAPATPDQQAKVWSLRPKATDADLPTVRNPGRARGGDHPADWPRQGGRCRRPCPTSLHVRAGVARRVSRSRVKSLV